MSSSRNALFCDRSFSEFRREQLEEMKDEISKLASDELQNNSTDSLSLIFAAKYTPSQIELQEPIKDDGGEVEKDVSHRQNLFIRDRSTPTYKKFHRLKVRLPFNVNKELFRCKPGRFDLNPPLADELNRNEIIYYIDYTTKNRDPEEIKEKIENKLEDWLDNVEKYVDNLNEDIEQMQEKFREEARSAIERRRDEVETKQQVMDELGVDTDSSESQGYVVPEKKRDIEIRSSQGEDLPEILPDQTFLDILEIIDDLGINIERSAERIRDLD
jgi:gas vesicle protein